ncbi:alpha/beta hydrolase family protein [Thalassotalea agarivorans]|uniref:Predicted alpha/beta hydrolase n=1 Tax=Thalassotalea agarivorans TaxID=349064 RepID=A0A1I0CD23_THASX|nr:alpha/beta fold hydrolase [Thalassotalea agarivorans]SET17481.1 Predicted alpha/beta hydrolase [Thalassotalea agarivorans]
MPQHQTIDITCADNTVLAATIFTPAITPKGAVLIAPATGIKRAFYFAFAEFLAEQGYIALTFDNRGIGDSLEGHIKHCNASLQQWGELDLTAALNYLQTHYPDFQYHLVGHSAGGQLIGLMPNADQLASVCNIACSSGRLRNMRFSYQLQAHFFMNMFIPVSNAIFGYTQSSWVGMGEPLPKRVARQWQQWCNGSGYVKMAFGKTISKHYYDTLTVPSLWLNAIDDDIANERNLDDMLSVFTKLPAETRMLSPQQYGLTEIGHMKFFSRKAKVLWPMTLDWIEQHTL